MSTKRKWVMIICYAIVFSTIAANYAFKPSTAELVVQLIILLVAQIWAMKMLKNEKADLAAALLPLVVPSLGTEGESVEEAKTAVKMATAAEMKGKK